MKTIKIGDDPSVYATVMITVKHQLLELLTKNLKN